MSSLEKMDHSIYKTYAVALDKAKYDIVIGRNITDSIRDLLVQKTQDDRVLIVIDDFFKSTVLDTLLPSLSSAGFSVHVHNFEAGKQHKNISEAMKIYETLESNDFARDSTLIAIGGGVIGDLAGFVASTYLRGMNLIQVPTTLTGMIDSSIGGKVAINFRKTVNAIGNYYHPLLNIIDLRFVDTLPERDFKAGLAEIIKCSIICDRSLFDFMHQHNEEILSLKMEPLLKIIYRAIEIKLDHVRDDVTEQNKRLKLNYGHTLGHSIETATGVFEEVYRHGEGVSLGMVGVAHIARDYFRHGDAILERHEDILRKYGLPIRIESAQIGFDRNKLLTDFMKIIMKDKKRKGKKLRLILPEDIGRSGIYSDVPDEFILKAFEYLTR